MDEEHFPLLFGPDELNRLRQLVDLDPTVVTAAALRSARPARNPDLIIGSWGMPRLDEALLARLPKLRALFYAAGTVKGIVTDAGWARGIRLTHAALENARPTAEFAFAEIILSLKRAWPRIFLLREAQEFQQRDPLVRGCYGSTVGLIALGKIGRLVAERLRTLDVNVVAYDPFVAPEDAARLGVRLCPLAEVFALSDVVSCHLPSTPKTQQLIDRPLLASMREGATFINTSRGQVVNEGDLVAVLRQRPDLFAILDVIENEPPAKDDPLFTLRNVALTPHIAGSVALECRRMGRMMVNEMERYLAGQPLQGEVRPEQLDILA